MTPDRLPDLDLGFNHLFWYFGWWPDRDLNPQYAHLPDVPRGGAIISHLKPDGSSCTSGINFDLPVMRQIFPEQACWKVESWEPLTLSPSILCTLCGDHGFIRNGQWVKA